jgi:Protein of unknown function (DUF1524)
MNGSKLGRALKALLLALVVLAGSLVAAPQAHATKLRARALLTKLVVRAERPAGYDRDKFTHWIDADHDGCDTRAEVLIAESRVAVTKTSGCSVVSGKWLSVFDRQTWRQASDVDIDHFVPLAEAWRSGAKRWSAARRTEYANDLGYRKSLNAMTDNLNSSKGDDDPASWLPPSYGCKYEIWWMQVKYRWRLKIDGDEKRALAEMMSRPCGSKLVKLPKRAPKTPQPDPDNCDDAYPTVCIPPPPPDLDCGDISYRNFTVLAPDPHGFDGDHDGVGCET